jgi:hypothetical protein
VCVLTFLPLARFAAGFWLSLYRVSLSYGPHLCSLYGRIVHGGTGADWVVLYVGGVARWRRPWIGLGSSSQSGRKHHRLPFRVSLAVSPPPTCCVRLLGVVFIGAVLSGSVLTSSVFTDVVRVCSRLSTSCLCITYRMLASRRCTMLRCWLDLVVAGWLAHFLQPLFVGA